MEIRRFVKELGRYADRSKSFGGFIASIYSGFRKYAFAQSAMTILIVCALAVVPVKVSSSPDPFALIQAEDIRHAALDADAIEDQHGHSHEDGTEEEQTAGHTHGHNPADHSHQFAYLISSADHWSMDGAQDWPKSLSDLVQSSTTFGIDRPPKLALTA